MNKVNFNSGTDYSLENLNFLLQQNGVRAVFSEEDLDSIDQATRKDDQKYLREAFGFALKAFLGEQAADKEFNESVEALLGEYVDGVNVIKVDARKKRDKKVRKVEQKEKKIADEMLKQI